MDRIIVVGGGPRGFSVVDRVVSLATASRLNVDIVVVEPGRPGPGIHAPDQPDYLMLNTVAGQATAFSDTEMTGGAPSIGGPGFLEWCQHMGVTAPLLPGCAPHEATRSDFMTRAHFGQYMSWAWQRLVATALPGIRVRHVRATGQQIVPSGDGAEVWLDDGSVLRAELVFVATGHGVLSADPPSTVDRIASYPLPDAVAPVRAGRPVAIAGMGLTALDVVAALTVGRGGRFALDDGTLAYRPSGDEPIQILFSRTGWLACARPQNPRRQPRTAGLRFTEHALALLRDSRRDRRLGLEADIMSLLRSDILADGLDQAQRRALLRVLGMDGSRWQSSARYEADVVAQSEWDLREATHGLGASVFKDRLEVLRDAREALRWVIKAGVLTGEDHRRFFSTIPALANRAAVGPQIDRLKELLAVARTGLVRFSVGPSPELERLTDGRWALTSTAFDEPCREIVDLVIDAHLEFPTPAGRDVLRASIQRWARRHPHDSRYVDLTLEGFVRTADGRCTAVCLIGVPSEGTNYYNNHILWPAVSSVVLQRIDRALATRLPHFYPGDGGSP